MEQDKPVVGETAAEVTDGAASITELTPEELKAQVEARIAQLEMTGESRTKEGQHVLTPLTADGLKARTTEEARAAAAPAPVKLATSNASTDVEGSMSTEEKRRMEAMIGAAKAKDTKVYSNLSDREIVVGSDDVDPRATIVVANCKNSSIVLDALCTKLYIQGCVNLKVTCNAKIVTQVVEMYKCQDIEANFATKVGTLQLDMSKKLSLAFHKSEHLGQIIWAGVWDLSVQLKDIEAVHETGYGKMKEAFVDAHEERTQFKLHLLNNKLINELVVRTENGFPTTKRELDAFMERQERNMKIMAQNMGVVLPNKQREAPKTGRNEACTCGSGRKFKKCCGMVTE